MWKKIGVLTLPADWAGRKDYARVGAGAAAHAGLKDIVGEEKTSAQRRRGDRGRMLREGAQGEKRWSRRLSRVETVEERRRVVVGVFQLRVWRRESGNWVEGWPQHQ